MTKIKYNGFSLPCNPETLKITYSNDLKELPRPHAGPVIQDYGPLNRTVNGEGIFSGENAFLHFIRFRAAAENGTGLLILPGFRPFYAHFKSLEYLGAPGHDFVKYRFEFVENTAKDYYNPSAPGAVYVTEGQTIWDIADKYGLSVEYIIRKNPGLTSLTNLETGREVIL